MLSEEADEWRRRHPGDIDGSYERVVSRLASKHRPDGWDRP